MLSCCLACVSFNFSIFICPLPLTASMFWAPTATLYHCKHFFSSARPFHLHRFTTLNPNNNQHFCSPLNFLSIDPSVTQSLPPTLSQKISRDIYSRRTNEKLFYEIWKSALWLTLPHWLQRQYLKAGHVESHILSNFRSFVSLIP